MKKINEAQYHDIEKLMNSLGPYDWGDTNFVLTQFRNFYFIELSELDFFNCVFLSTDKIRAITPHGESRKLKFVAEKALSVLYSTDGVLGLGWDLNEIYQKASQTMLENHSFFCPLVLRDTLHNENEPDAFKYIHDGCHRSLGYAMLLLQEKLVYSPVSAYLATYETIL